MKLKKMKLKKRKGAVYVMVLVVFVFVCLFSSLMVSSLNQSVYQTHMYGMNMKCYYLNNQTAEAVVAVLLDQDNALLESGGYPMSDTMVHYSAENKVVGESKITLKKERHDYYDENKEWVVAYITTTIPDERASRHNEKYTYEGMMMILVDNPLIQLYNIDPESL